MAILDDFTINTTAKTVRHTSGNTVYTVNALYSAIKDVEDDADNMDDEVIMTAQTPLEYTIENGWFIDNPSTTFLSGGAITTSGYRNEIQRIVTTNSGTDPVLTDLGKIVADSGAGTSGILLHYDLDEFDNGTQANVWYVRSGDNTAYTANLTITGGTGAQAVSTSEDGEEIFTNVFSFGTITATVSPQFYIEQSLNGSDHRVIEWVANSNFSRGKMDVLLRTQVEGSAIDGGKMLITIRQPGTSYDSSEQILNGGRNPFALNSADDPDNLSPEYYVLFDSATSGFAAGQSITANSKAWYAEIVAVSYFSATSGYLGIRGLNESINSIADNDTFRNSQASATINGTPGDRIIGYDQTTALTTIGQIITGDTSSTKAILRGIHSEYLVCQVNNDFRADSTYYTPFVVGEEIRGASQGRITIDSLQQDAVSGMDDIDIVFNHGSIGTSSNTLTVGMHVTSGSKTGTVTKVDGSTIHFGNTSEDFASGETISDDDSTSSCVTNTAWTNSHTTTKAFAQSSLFKYDVIIFMSNNTVSNGYQYGKFTCGDGNPFLFQKLDLDGTEERNSVQGQFYLSAYSDLDTPDNTYDKIGKRAAPLGNFAGGTWFNARGIWLEDVASSDLTKYNLIDSDGATQIPPIFVSVKQGNTVSGDRVFVVEDDGTGKTNKVTYNSHAINNLIDTSDFDVSGNIRQDTPSTGYIRVVDTSSVATQTKEHRYKYNSFSGDSFTLTPFIASTGTTGVGGLVHTNSSRNFTTEGVEVGMMVRNTTSGDIGFIDTVGTTTLTVKQLEGGGDGEFDTSDVIEINKLVATYASEDTAYVPYIDRIATGNTETVSVIFSTNRNLIGKVRNKGVIYAFVGTGSLTNGGATITTIRTADGIAV